MLATIVIQPHVKRKVTADKLLPLPWDRQQKKQTMSGKRLTSTQQRERMKALVEKLGDEL